MSGDSGGAGNEGAVHRIVGMGDGKPHVLLGCIDYRDGRPVRVGRYVAAGVVDGMLPIEEGVLIKCVVSGVSDGMYDGSFGGGVLHPVRLLVVRWRGWKEVKSGGDREWHKGRVGVYRGVCTKIEPAGSGPAVGVVQGSSRGVGSVWLCVEMVQFDAGLEVADSSKGGKFTNDARRSFGATERLVQGKGWYNG